MLEAFLQFIGEFLLPFLLEVLVDLGWDFLAAPSGREPRPVVAGFGWFFSGVLAGVVSLWLVPHNLLHGGWRLANLVCTPFAVGILAGIMERLRQPVGVGATGSTAAAAPANAPLTRSVYAFLFALAIALVRFGAH